MTLFGLKVGINVDVFYEDNYGHIPCSCVCVLQLYTGLDIFNLTNQKYHVGLRSTVYFCLVTCKPLMWNMLF